MANLATNFTLINQAGRTPAQVTKSPETKAFFAEASSNPSAYMRVPGDDSHNFSPADAPFIDASAGGEDQVRMPILPERVSVASRYLNRSSRDCVCVETAMRVFIILRRYTDMYSLYNICLSLYDSRVELKFRG